MTTKPTEPQASLPVGWVVEEPGFRVTPVYEMPERARVFRTLVEAQEDAAQGLLVEVENALSRAFVAVFGNGAVPASDPRVVAMDEVSAGLQRYQQARKHGFMVEVSS